jgi:hypothetical protein
MDKTSFNKKTSTQKNIEWKKCQQGSKGRREKMSNLCTRELAYFYISLRVTLHFLPIESLSNSVFIIFNIISSQSFLPFNIMSHLAFIIFDITSR